MLENTADYGKLSINIQHLRNMYKNILATAVVASFSYGMTAQALVSSRNADDPMVVLAAEIAAVAPEEEGQNIVEEDVQGAAEENIATRCLMAQLSIVQGLTERLSSDLVAAVPEEVAESLQEQLAEAQSLESMAIDIGAGEYEELQAEMAQDPAVQAVLDRLDEVTARLEEKSYYNCPALEEVVSQILNILSDLQ